MTIIEKFCDAQPERKAGVRNPSITERAIDVATIPISNREPKMRRLTDRQESPFPLCLPREIFAKDSAWPRTFLPGSVQNIECDVTSRKQSPKKLLPGATTTPCRYTKPQQFHRGKPSRISPPRAKIAEHSLLLSPRNFIGLQDRDCRSVRLTVSAQK